MRPAPLALALVSLAALACTDGSSALFDGPAPLDAGAPVDGGGPDLDTCPPGRADVTVDLVDRFFSPAGLSEAPRAGEVAAVFESSTGWEEILGEPAGPELSSCPA